MGWYRLLGSRNDQVMTDLRMKVRNDINEVSVLLTICRILAVPILTKRQ